jgi:hypothetical protein
MRGANSLTKDGQHDKCPAHPWCSKLNVLSGTRHTASLTHPAEVRLIRDRGEDSSLTRRASSPLSFAPVLLRAHSPGPIPYASPGAPGAPSPFGPRLGGISGAAGVDEAVHEVPDVLFHRSERPVKVQVLEEHARVVALRVGPDEPLEALQPVAHQFAMART